MTSTYELDLYWVKIKHGAEYLGQRSFRSKIIVRTHTHTHTHTHMVTFTLPEPLKWSADNYCVNCYSRFVDITARSFIADPFRYYCVTNSMVTIILRNFS